MSQNKYKQQARRKRKQKSAWPMVVLVAGGLLLVLGAIFAFSQPSKPKAPIEVTGSPSLKVDKEEVDLGDVKLGQTVQVSFQITNIGDKPLRFAKEPYVEVKEGC
jgi:cell division septal protein FtsQ